MQNDLARLIVRVDAGPDGDDVELDELTTQLRDDLLHLDVASVDRVTIGEAPAGTRAGEVMALGALAVTFVTSPEVIKSVLGLAQAWLSPRAGRTIELELGGDKIKLSGISSDEQRKLMQLFVERHTQR